MNLQARMHRRLSRHRVHATPADRSVPPGQALLDYLAAGRGIPIAVGASRLRETAHDLLHSGEPLRLGLRAGELLDRFNWFLRLLELWPADEREAWLREQLLAAQRHPLAGSPLHDALDARLFDPLLSPTLRLRLQALWLAVVAPGAVSLDPARRARDQAQAMALFEGWLRDA
jgi:hypothetical protein